MTNENDLIRRGDVLDAANDADPLELSIHGATKIMDRIVAIPAVAVSQPANPTIKDDSCQRVTVKPLVWRGDSIRLTAGGMGKMYECMRCFHGQKGAGWSDYDEDWHQNLEAAKAAAQSDYEARILAAIDTQPDQRDAVIARLVEALTEVHKKAIGLRGDQAYREFARYAEKKTRAAIAAAKGGAA
jgi:hypothetical protein